MTPPNPLRERPWVSVFMGVCMRAIQRVHHDHGRWSIGPHWNMNSLRAFRMSKGRGIELADEPTVCAAITQEFLTSSAVAGIWEHGERKEIRFFDIEREAAYRSGKGKRVDLFVRKFVPCRGAAALRAVPRPSFVEAKRARLWYPVLQDGSQRRGPSQLAAIRRDIRKLRVEMRYRKTQRKPRVLGHILVWGVYSGDQRDSPTSLLEHLKDENLAVQSLRLLPLDWTESDPRSTPFVFPKLTMVLWLLLAEVDAKRNSGSLRTAMHAAGRNVPNA